MPFNPLGFALTSAVTRDMADRARATQLSILGGLLGNNLAGVALIAAAARQDGTTTETPTGETPAERPTRVQVPDLDDDQETTEKLIRSRGLVPVLEGTSSEDPMDSVIGSDPPPGTIVRRGSRVTVFVSAGIEVPNVVGKELADAAEEVQTAGFEVHTQVSEKKGREDHVESQEPTGGSFADGGSVVTLTTFAPKRAVEAVGEGKKE